MKLSYTAKKIAKVLFTGIMVIFIGLLVASLSISIAYADKILPGISIHGRDVGGQSINEATYTVDKSLFSTVDLKIEDQTVSAAPATLGINWNSEQVSKSAFAIGHGENIWQNLGNTIATLFVKRNLDLPITINEEQLNGYIEETIGQLITNPVDAHLEVKNNQVSVVPGTDGLAIDLDSLKTNIKAAAFSGQSAATVEAKTTVVQPKVEATDLTQYRDQIASLAQVPLTITANDKTLTPTLTQKLSWYIVTKNDNGLAVAIDKTAVNNTIAALAKTYDTKAVNDVVDANGQVITAGSDGQKIDQSTLNSTLESSLNQILNGQNSAVTVVAVVSPVTRGQTTQIAVDGSVVPAIDTDAKFIQVNLAQQKMYLFENRQLINVFIISSGKAGYETPKGVHKIYNKSSRAWSAEYKLYMPYWQAITPDGKYGIHELPEWPNGRKEGENHLGRPVSHGCMRLGVGAAEYVYNWAPIGTAVVVQ